MGKTMMNLVLNRRANEPFGFRIIGGKAEGLTVKVEKVVMGSPASDAGLKVHDFLVSVNGQEIFGLNHAQVVKLIKNAGNSLNLAIERGDWIVPNFEEIWPSGKKKGKHGICDPEKGLNYVKNAMQQGLPGHRNDIFTTVGKPRVETHQYDNPIECYSEDMLKEMSEKGSWQMQLQLGPGGIPMGGASGPLNTGGQPFTPGKSSVLAALKQDGAARPMPPPQMQQQQQQMPPPQQAAR